MDTKNDTVAFQVGDDVEWTSQAGGQAKTKVGKVIAVIPPRVMPFKMKYGDESHYTLPDGQRISYSRTNYGGGMARSAESYVVSVDDGKAYYWPRVSSLRHSQESTAHNDGSSGTTSAPKGKRRVPN